jgi:hypothetical protein
MTPYYSAGCIHSTKVDISLSMSLLLSYRGSIIGDFSGGEQY